jgi:transposase
MINRISPRWGFFDMMNLSFTAEVVTQLQDLRFNHPHPRVQLKAEVLLLKANGISHGSIGKIVGICGNTVRAHFQEYQIGGIESISEVHFQKPVSKLASFSDEIKASFLEHPPASVKEAAAKIVELTKIERSLTQVRKYLLSIGLKRRKTGSIPAKADSVIQEKFKTEILEPKLEQARKGERVVYFVDAAHFVLAPFLGYLWSFVRVFVKAPCGRQRFNVLGALDAVTHQLLTVTNDSYINALSVCDLIKIVAELNIGVPVTLILDNARYQKCAIVFALAESLKVELVYLPSYSPNLNLIERMWKFTKKECLNSKYYTDFTIFSNAIANFLKNVHLDHKDELNSLLTHKFQDFAKAHLAFVS